MPSLSLLKNVTHKTAKASVSVECSELELNLDPTELARGPSQALADAIGRGIRAIQDSVAPATKKFRAAAERAIGRGSRWALERYPTGRADGSDRLFNDSGLLAAATARPDGDGFAIVATARGDARGDSASSMLARLQLLVPALGDPLGDMSVRAAIDDTAKVLFSKVEG